MTDEVFFWTTAAAASLLASVGCEFWARLVHRYIWHGVLWAVHQSHHAGPHDMAPCSARSTSVEMNDLFALLHAAVAMALVMAGLQMRQTLWGGACVGLGAGLTLYGLAYGLVHDALIHERVCSVTWRRGYWRRVRGAHLAHHRTGGAPYGLFLAPFERRHAHPTRCATSVTPCQPQATSSVHRR